MPTTSVTNLVTRGLAAADMEDNFVTPTQALAWANVEHHYLYSKIARFGIPYHESDEPITFTGANQYTISEPMAILAVFNIETDGSYRRLELINPADNQPPSNSPSTEPRKYRVLRNTDNNVTFRFYPNPPSGSGVIRIIPHPKTLVYSGPTANQAAEVKYPLSWEECIVLGIARRALAKEETINPLIESQYRECHQMVEEAAREQLMSEAPRIRDARTGQVYYGYDWVYL